MRSRSRPLLLSGSLRAGAEFDQCDGCGAERILPRHAQACHRCPRSATARPGPVKTVNQPRVQAFDSPNPLSLGTQPVCPPAPQRRNKHAKSRPTARPMPGTRPYVPRERAAGTSFPIVYRHCPATRCLVQTLCCRFRPRRRQNSDQLPTLKSVRTRLVHRPPAITRVAMLRDSVPINCCLNGPVRYIGAEHGAVDRMRSLPR